ncbi:hypothetical protein GCM10023353_36480 [Tomitella cavernea]|uniref:Uncharacterized protein n=1 Tax=Tomitella cavernea TaxID=1387982 RepID=A0ABP9D1U7_9ACTN
MSTLHSDPFQALCVIQALLWLRDALWTAYAVGRSGGVALEPSPYWWCLA